MVIYGGMMLHFGLIHKKRAEKITGPPVKVSIISPANGTVNQQLDVYMSWVKPSMARSYDVYFGTSAGSIVQVSSDQAARVYAPSGLALDSTYYFRIDVVNEFGTTAGDVCSFSTWAADDVLLDENGDPITDEQGYYIDTSSGWDDKDLWIDKLFWRN